jgi:iron-sulfur cluster assembly accessory protein
MSVSLPVGTQLANKIRKSTSNPNRRNTMINLTPSAVSAVEKFIKGSDVPVAGLRIAISGGGCSGFQYGMSLEQTKNEDDVVVEFGSVTLLVDPLSAPLLTGVQVDFVDSLNGSGFKFENPNASSSCACGSSFSA